MPVLRGILAAVAVIPALASFSPGPATAAIESPAVERFAGADRFDVSAKISRETFQPGVPMAYVATGATFADALSGAPAAGVRGGPVLLVAGTSIPTVIQQELARLEPRSITILGGPNSVSATVETALKSYTDGGVSRISGATRYEVSAKISKATFSPGVKVAFVATGETFADALSGAPAAGTMGGPVLLVPGANIPKAIADELDRLKPENIEILGGPNSVSLAVEQQLWQYTGGVTRVSGPDRYAVSARISELFFPVSSPVAYIATGEKFADALSGAPAASVQGGPVLLVPGSSIPTVIANELKRLKPQRIVILGGVNSVAAALEPLLEAYIDEGTTTTPTPTPSPTPTATPTPPPAGEKPFDVSPVPLIKGTGQSGVVLILEQPGTWSPRPTQMSYQWYRSGEPIPLESSSRYTPRGEDIGHDITVSVTAEREGFKKTARVSLPTRVTCGPPGYDATRTAIVTGDISAATTWSSGATDVVRVCETGQNSAPEIAAGTKATIKEGVSVELYTALRIGGTLNIAGTATKPVSLKSNAASSVLISSKTGGTLTAQHLNAPSLGVDWVCGSLEISSSVFARLHDNSVLTSQEAAACEASQDHIRVADSTMVGTSGNFTVDISAWTGAIILERNSIAKNVTILHNRGLDRFSAKEANGSATIRGNTISGSWGLSYSDDCDTTCSETTTPLEFQNNRLPAPTANIQIVAATLTDGSIIGNSGANPALFTYGEIRSSGALTLPLPHEGNRQQIGSNYGELFVGTGSSVTLKPGTSLALTDIFVRGSFLAGAQDAARASIETPPEHDGGWSMTVRENATATLTNLDVRSLRDVWTAGELTVLDSTISDAIGTADELRDEMPYNTARSVIRQHGGSIYLDAEYVRSPRILKQYSGSAVVRGSFVEPTTDRALIMTCEWEVQECFVDARDVDWGPAGPFPLSDDPLTPNPPARFCGTGLAYPWTGSAQDEARQWVGGCDGVDHNPARQIAEAQESYDSALAQFVAECERDPEQYGGACDVVANSRACLSAAMQLAQQSSTFPLAPPDDADVAGKLADGAVGTLEALDRPSLRIPTAGLSLALKAGSVYSTLKNVAAAYSTCGP
jgi:putative cell wall-binding protein